jgi:hypothetical protein
MSVLTARSTLRSYALELAESPDDSLETRRGTLYLTEGPFDAPDAPKAALNRAGVIVSVPHSGPVTVRWFADSGELADAWDRAIEAAERGAR